MPNCLIKDQIYGSKQDLPIQIKTPVLNKIFRNKLINFGYRNVLLIKSINFFWILATIHHIVQIKDENKLAAAFVWETLLRVTLAHSCLLCELETKTTLNEIFGLSLGVTMWKEYCRLSSSLENSWQKIMAVELDSCLTWTTREI